MARIRLRLASIGRGGLTLLLGATMAPVARVEVSDAAGSTRPTTVGMFVAQTLLYECANEGCSGPPGTYHLSVSLTPGRFTELVRLERRIHPAGLSITNTAPVPAISDSGRWLAYGAPHRRIVAGRIGISTQTLLSQPQTLLRVGRRDLVYAIAWDHKARYLVVQARLGGEHGIWRVDRLTGTRRLLAREHLDDSDAAYDTLSVSSTGSVAYMADAPIYGELATAIYATSLKGASPRLLAQPGHDADDAMPAWSPDGQDLAYVRDAGTGEPGPQTGALALVGQRSDPRRRPTVIGASPAFSPDGKWLVSTRNTDSEVNALTMTDSHLGHPKRLNFTGDIRGLGAYSSIAWLRTIP
jgi:hypothetical protein